MVELFGLENLPAVSTDLNYNYRPNGKCHNFNISEIQSRRNNPSIANSATILTGYSSGLFDSADWQKHVSGRLRSRKTEVNEAQFNVRWCTYVPKLWLTDLRYLGCEARNMPLYFAFGIDLLFIARYTNVVKNEGYGKNRSTVAVRSVCSPRISLTLVILPAFLVAQKSSDIIFVEQVSLYFIAVGLVAAKVTYKLVIAHLTKDEMEYLDWPLLGPGLLFLNQYFNCEYGYSGHLVYSGLNAKLCTSHLHINLLAIPYPTRIASINTVG
uniref:Uncharacterized protein n=1 Tax=Glossina palpalis gambiensis TaxID=67801 RepID=A0A1B0BYV1_9MUSC